MRHPLIIILPILLACSLIASGADELTPQKTFCWKITSEKGTAYLMGSLHLCKKDLYPLDQAITQAYDASKCLVIEADISTPQAVAKVQEVILTTGVYRDGSSLKDHVSEACYKKIEAYCKKQNLNLSQMGMMRPWLLGLQLTNLESSKLGYNPEMGLDKHFLNRAKKEKKPVKEMESVTSQLEMFSSMSDELQEISLISSLDEVLEIKDILNRMTHAWAFGDSKAMINITLESLKKEPRLKPYYAKIYDERNVNMATKIEEYLNSGVTHFVITGCNHIPGKMGILEILKSKKEKSYKIEQLKALGKPKKEDPPKVGEKEDHGL